MLCGEEGRGRLHGILAGSVMEFSAVIFGDCVDLSRHVTRNHSHIPATLSAVVISASAVLPVDSYASSRAAVRSDPFRPPSAVPQAFVRRVRRIRRRSSTEDNGEDDFFDGGDGDDGPFGGGSGTGWGSWPPTGSEWEEPDRWRWLLSSADSAFDVIYEVLCWIALSNCAHFTFKKMSRLVAERGKDLSIRLVLPIC